MSETAYERGYRVGSSEGGASTGSNARASRGGSGTSFFTKQLGPLPVWGWMAVTLLLAVGYYLWHKNQSASSASSAGTSTTNDSQIPQFVNQVYTNPTPPADNDGGTPATSKVNVSDVIGQSLEAGQGDLQGQGFIVKGFNFTPGAPKGSVRIITGETPKPGSVVPKGTTVTLTGKTVDSKKTTTKPPAKKPAKK